MAMTTKNKLPVKFAPPPLPQAYKMAAPLNLPVKKSGFWGRFVTRCEMDFERDYYNKAASIQEAQRAAVKAFNDTTLEAVTFGLKYKDTVERYAFDSRMRDLRLEEQQLRNRNLYFESKHSEIDYLVKEKEFQREYGSSEKENGDS
jgi:hypothetical protein